MQETENKIDSKKQKLQIRAYALLCLILLLTMGFYSFTKWQQYKAARDGVSKNREFISILRAEGTKEKADFEIKKEKAGQLRREIDQKLKVIFPVGDDYTALTRQIDLYEQELSRKNSPFEVSNIDYLPVIEEENYSILPMKMNIRSSDDNFTKFLHLVESSGSLKNKLRLMDISSIKLNFQKKKEEKAAPEIITFSVFIKAYFQK